MSSGKISNTNDWFLSKMNDIFGSRYDFSMSRYSGNRNDIKYRCKACDKIYKKKAMYLLRGCGCRVCSRKTIARKKTSNIESFIEKSNIIHSNKYDYSICNYKRSNEKVKILCKIHGEFMQQPSNHLNGQGCPKCSNLEILEIFRPYDDAMLYNLMFIPKDGSFPFLKIGITTKDSWKSRFSGSVNLGFDIKEVQVFKGSVKECARREKIAMDYLDEIGARYKCKELKGLHLGGWTECYRVIDHDECINIIFQMKGV